LICQETGEGSRIINFEVNLMDHLSLLWCDSAFSMPMGFQRVQTILLATNVCSIGGLVHPSGISTALDDEWDKPSSRHHEIG
jgi:hypothetical protein